ncbi:MAG: UDP-glucose 4-epimerase GalE [Spirochaetaceae bacterium]|jgi:UDP-glucose 4-epimerase|nr:UDP-glucose 4-epimerase GalE [Spirochaetaceae bacterium]
MKILVIGGAGYIGSHVVRALLDMHHTVCVFDNMSSGQKENLFDGADFTAGDILDYPALRSALAAGFDAVIHLAAFKAAGESMILPEKYSVNNISGAINILNAMCETACKNLVFSSSAAVFGDPQYLPVDEEHPVNPENYYGFTKLEIERIAAWYGRLKGLRCASLRYFNAAGYDLAGRIQGLEKNPANLIPIIMEAAAGMRTELSIYGDDYDTPDGTCIRDYIHVSDLARAHTQALDYLTAAGESIVLNLGSETGSSVLEVLETARKITGKPIPAKIAPRRAGDPAKLTASSARAKKILGWKAECSDLQSIVSSTWKMYTK